MASDFRLEAPRQMIHLVFGMLLSVLTWMFGRNLLFFLVPTTLLFIAIPRLYPSFFLYRLLMQFFERKKNVDAFPFRGLITFNFGACVPILMLAPDVAAAIIAVLAVGDSTSTLFGRYLGRLRIGEKSIEGLTAFVFFSYIAASMYVSINPAFQLALVGGIVELTGIGEDNLTIPFSLSVFALLFF